MKVGRMLTGIVVRVFASISHEVFNLQLAALPCIFVESKLVAWVVDHLSLVPLPAIPRATHLTYGAYDDA